MHFSALVAALLAGSAVAIPTMSLSANHASPNPNSTETSLMPRVEGAGDGIVALVMLIEELIKNEKNAYDPDIANSYVVFMNTRDGANCVTAVAPASAVQWTDEAPMASDVKWDTLSPPHWQVCYLNGRQYFSDPNIGDFSVEFSEAGGVNGNTEDGLHTPILRVANIGNNQPIDVQGMASASGNKLCDYHKDMNTHDLIWVCGIPKVGKSFFGLSNIPPITTTTYAKGWCTTHFVQHQIPKGGSKYGFSALIKDANQQYIGMAGDPITTGDDPLALQMYGETKSIDSVLPKTLDVTIGKTDDAPIKFSYNGQTWDTSNSGAHACKVGKYDSGARQGDCGFTC